MCRHFTADATYTQAWLIVWKLRYYGCVIYLPFICHLYGAAWLSGSVIDSHPRGWGFNPLLCQSVFEQDTASCPWCWVISKENCVKRNVSDRAWTQILFVFVLSPLNVLYQIQNIGIYDMIFISDFLLEQVLEWRTCLWLRMFICLSHLFQWCLRTSQSWKIWRFSTCSTTKLKSCQLKLAVFRNWNTLILGMLHMHVSYNNSSSFYWICPCLICTRFLIILKMILSFYMMTFSSSFSWCNNFIKVYSDSIILESWLVHVI